MRPLLALGLALGLLAAGARADNLPPSFRQALKAAQIPTANVAVVIQPVEATAPLVSHNARQAMSPASVMKLLTTYAALDLLGPAYTWKTTALADTAPVADTLNGNLYLKGGGDPKLALEHFTALLRQLRVRGVRHIAGDVVLDRSAFLVPAEDPGAFDNKPLRPYNVGPDALLVNFRALTFSLAGLDGKVRLLAETPAEGLTVDNQLKLVDGPCSTDWKDFVGIRLLPEGTGQRLEFTGNFSPACGEKHLSIAPFSADGQVAGLFKALWRELGGSLSGQVRAGATPATARPLAQQESPTLAELVRDTNKFSNNVMARQIFLALGNDEGPATTDRARQRIADWLTRRGLRLPELVLDNGSGLSRRERISADGLGRLLLDAWHSPVMPELIASLPIVGIDGTMKKRLTDSAATGRAHIKTGYLEGVRAAAGFALDSHGRNYVVICLINHPRAVAGAGAIDSLIQWVGER